MPCRCTSGRYLTFTGNYAEAFTRYQEIFGGPLDLLTMAEAPGGAPEGTDPDVVMHASLTTEGGARPHGRRPSCG